MYTKGEWRASFQYPYGVYATDGKRPPTTTPIATMTAPDQVEMEANAQLIAKSPRMYELLKQLADWDAGKFGKESNIKIIEISKQASKVIAKAEGK